MAAMVLAFLFLHTNNVHAASAPNCSPAGRVTFICVVTNVEDFAPDAKWVIGSDLPTPSNPQGNLYLFGSATRWGMQGASPNGAGRPWDSVVKAGERRFIRKSLEIRRHRD